MAPTWTKMGCAVPDAASENRGSGAPPEMVSGIHVDVLASTALNRGGLFPFVSRRRPVLARMYCSGSARSQVFEGKSLQQITAADSVHTRRPLHTQTLCPRSVQINPMISAAATVPNLFDVASYRVLLRQSFSLVRSHPELPHGFGRFEVKCARIGEDENSS